MKWFLIPWFMIGTLNGEPNWIPASTAIIRGGGENFAVEQDSYEECMLTMLTRNLELDEDYNFNVRYTCEIKRIPTYWNF